MPALLSSRVVRWLVLGLLIGLAGFGWAVWNGAFAPQPLLIVVMDPLAKPLACACVGGYAQRDYDVLAGFLGKELGRPFRVIYAESFERALPNSRAAKVALVIGKQSLVQHDAKRANLRLRPIGRLTGSDGSTTLTGLFIVKTNDSAQRLEDLAGRKVLFGPAESVEKHGAALAALRAAGVTPATTPETRGVCSEAALEVQESTNAPLPAAVISSYALPLLEGCGSIPPGSFRVVGKTAPVPFITVFLCGQRGTELESGLRAALLRAGKHPVVLDALESKQGFEPLPPLKEQWPGWRGAGRDGQAGWLPQKLPGRARFLWRKPLNAPGLGGVAVAGDKVIVGDRDQAGEKDVFHCFNAADGAPVWEFSDGAPGTLDYGASPRATPVICGDLVYTLSAFGALHCLDLYSGEVRWKTHLARQFGAKMPAWGFACSPLVEGDLLVINPGAPAASVVALDRFTGEVVWKTPGPPAAYAAFICGSFGGKRQIVGYDAESLGGWDIRTGARLWKLVPENPGDFNVPTPLAWQGRLVVATENNGARIYNFKKDGTIVPAPVALNSGLSPDASSPVIAGNLLIGCAGGLKALGLPGLQGIWEGEADAFANYASLITARDRILAMSFGGELCLLQAGPSAVQVISRLRVFEEGSETYAHPALQGHSLYVRDRAAIGCLPLE